MTYDTLRYASVLVKEAELLSASNDFIHNFYSTISAKFNKGYGVADVLIDAETENKLLSKNDRFIDLTLAQYCLFGESIKRLFTKAILDDDLPLKLTCLSNRSLSKSLYANSLPGVFFGDDLDLHLNWFKSISDKEIDILFRNETIDDEWISSLLECDNDFWNSLSDEKRIRIVQVLSQNPRANTVYDSVFIDGGIEYDYNKVFSNIWDLSKKVPVSSRWASALEMLLNKTVDDRYDFDSIEVAKRWVLVVDNSSNKGEKSYLNSFESVRFHLYKNVIKDLYGKDCSNNEHFDNPDIAYRVCAYSKLKNITIDDVNSIVEKDGALAIHYLLMNENLWRLEETRELLKDLCFKMDEKSSGSDLECVNSFLVREKKMEELHPKWFLEKIFDESNDDDKPLNLGMMREFIKELKEDLVNSILLWSNSYGKRIMKIEWIFYGVIATVVLVLMK